MSACLGLMFVSLFNDITEAQQVCTNDALGAFNHSLRPLTIQACDALSMDHICLLISCDPKTPSSIVNHPMLHVGFFLIILFFFHLSLFFIVLL